ncbi:ADP/ATP-dependent (S)-NAD(P)H-hydrate dehydratase [Microbacterium sp. H1-D42]|uniref:ADP-dependent NAD(P)H-hydrate dehydratase n=1 Tax=Microbacterium sp. H1-D42 TaxID=2925844 RepID=UPI001F53185F|nr:ADP/ATP-dependent (S)-NAD(P)H-hydrate dehydratase [Microbacterium sp. H1-D42]UNK69666.1 NAD(P)H-hydrate dehydratase [Microbacterium sp. H1-D42]
MLREWTRADTIDLLSVPTADDDKYSRGVVALRTGSAEYPGAAVLGVEAAWRSGAGYVRYLGDAVGAVLARRPETVAGADIGDMRAGAWVIGSGSDAAHRSGHEQAVLVRILGGTAPVVVDAGALDLAEGAVAPLVLTPHAGELARLRQLLGLEVVDLSAEQTRVAAVVETAEHVGATVLLKGARSVVAAPRVTPIVVSGAPHWLATAGTGDVLAGILGTMLATNPDRPHSEAAAAAAWLHGYAAALASGTADGGIGHPIVALDVAEALPRAIGELLS